MSASTIVVHVAAVRSDSTIARPIDWRMRESGAADPAATGAGFRGLGCAESRRALLRRGRLVGPVRRLDVHRRLGRGTAAALLEVREHVLLAHAPAATGPLDLLEVEVVLGGHPHDDRRVAPAAGAARAAPFCAEPLPVGAAASPWSSPASPGASSATSASLVPSDECASPGLASVAISASTVPTSTVSPTATRISCSRPAAGASTSVSILSVEIAAMTSSASTQSPTCFFHSTTVPSATRDAHLGHRDAQ